MLSPRQRLPAVPLLGRSPPGQQGPLRALGRRGLRPPRPPRAKALWRAGRAPLRGLPGDRRLPRPELALRHERHPARDARHGDFPSPRTRPRPGDPRLLRPRGCRRRLRPRDEGERDDAPPPAGPGAAFPLSPDPPRLPRGRGRRRDRLRLRRRVPGRAAHRGLRGAGASRRSRRTGADGPQRGSAPLHEPVRRRPEGPLRAEGDRPLGPRPGPRPRGARRGRRAHSPPLEEEGPPRASPLGLGRPVLRRHRLLRRQVSALPPPPLPPPAARRGGAPRPPGRRGGWAPLRAAGRPRALRDVPARLPVDLHATPHHRHRVEVVPRERCAGRDGPHPALGRGLSLHLPRPPGREVHVGRAAVLRVRRPREDEAPRGPARLRRRPRPPDEEALRRDHAGESRYPDTDRLFRLLFAGDLGYSLVRTFSSPPQLFGVRLPSELADESFSVYDHPKAVVFRNAERLTADEIARRLRVAKPSKTLSRSDLLLARPDDPHADSGERIGGTRSTPLALLLWAALLQAFGLAAWRLLGSRLPAAPGVYALSKIAGVALFGAAAWGLVSWGPFTFVPSSRSPSRWG